MDKSLQQINVTTPNNCILKGGKNSQLILIPNQKFKIFSLGTEKGRHY